MPRRPASFVQSDLSRILRALKDAGVSDGMTVRVERDAFVIAPLQAGTSGTTAHPPSSTKPAPLDDLDEI